MTNTIKNITVGSGKVVDLYAESRVLVGDEITVSMIGNGVARLYSGAVKPLEINHSTGYRELYQGESMKNDTGDSGAFISSHSGCTVNVKGNAIPIPVFQSIIPFGDSFTDIGDSPRLANGDYGVGSRGWWVWASMLVDGQYNNIDASGVSGNTTIDLLARMNDVLLSGAEVVSILIGTNDINEGRTPEQTRDSMITIVDQVIANNQKVLINRVAHRDIADGMNSDIDALNGYYELIASTRVHCYISGEYTEFNAFIDADNASEVTTDGLHPNSKGGYLLGKVVAVGLSDNLPSLPPVIVNEAPNQDFIGTSGLVLSGATGQAPDDWRIYYADPTDLGANPAEGVGSTIESDIDGNYVAIKTGLLQASTGRSLFRSGNVTVSQGNEYMVDADISMASGQEFSALSIVMVTQSASAGNVEFSFNVPTGGVELSNFRMATPAINVLDSTYVNILINATCLNGSRVELQIRDIRLYQVQ